MKTRAFKSNQGCRIRMLSARCLRRRESVAMGAPTRAHCLVTAGVCPR